MDDTKLLEDAARAIGRRITGWNAQHGAAVAVLDDNTFWQPLTENHITDCMGDALRLAVKLGLEEPGLEVLIGAKSTAAVKRGESFAREPHGPDPYAATRRAIVRAAAALAPTTPPKEQA